MLTHFSLTARSSLTHTQRSFGFRNSQLNPRHSACIFSETDDSSSCTCQQSSMRARTLPMPTLLAHTHRFLGSRNSTTGNLPACSARLLCIHCVPDDRDSACVPSPSLSPRSPSSRSSLTHTNRFLGFRNSTSARLMSAPTSVGSMYSNSMYDAQHSV